MFNGRSFSNRRALRVRAALTAAVLASFLSLGAAAAADTQRDPTRPLDRIQARKTPEHLRLHSILISDRRRVAIVNGKTVRENDNVDGARIMKILPGKVVVRQEGVERSLFLRQSVKKQSSG